MNTTWTILALGVAAATGLYAVISSGGQEDDDETTPSSPRAHDEDRNAGGAQRITGATAASVVTGHDANEGDPLQPDHRLTEADAKAVRAEDRKRGTSPDGAPGVNPAREQMYRDTEADAGGESGTQGGVTGREDNNPVGRHK